MKATWSGSEMQEALTDVARRLAVAGYLPDEPDGGAGEFNKALLAALSDAVTWKYRTEEKAGDVKARAFLVSTMENANLPLHERMHAASLLLK